MYVHKKERERCREREREISSILVDEGAHERIRIAGFESSEKGPHIANERPAQIPWR
jgi:hypothetical protein